MILMILSMALIGAILYIVYLIKHYKNVFEQLASDIIGINGFSSHDDMKLTKVRKLIMDELNNLDEFNPIWS